MKKFRPFLLALLFVTLPLSIMLAHASISGDDVCGSIGHKCSIADIKSIAKGIMTLVVSLGLPLLVVFVTYRFVMAWFALQQGNANAYKDALKKAGNAILGFVFIVALFAGLLTAALRMFGVKDSYLKILNIFSSVQIVERAYADDSTCSSATLSQSCTLSDGSAGKCSAVLISNNTVYKCAPALVQTVKTDTGTIIQVNDLTKDPQYQNTQPSAPSSANNVQNLNPTNNTSLYDFILGALRLIMRFFIYPALIAIWVWTGFAFVAAQGAPDALVKAKKWLVWAFVTTLIIFMLQGFLVALKGTVQKILPGTQTIK